MGSIVDEVRIKQDFDPDGYTFEVLPSEDEKPKAVSFAISATFTAEELEGTEWAPDGAETISAIAQANGVSEPFVEQLVASVTREPEYIAMFADDPWVEKGFSLIDETARQVADLHHLAEGYGMSRYKVLLLEDDTMRYPDEEKYMDPTTLRNMGEAYARIEAFLAWSSDWAQRHEVCSDTFDGYLLLHNLVAQEQRTGPQLSDVQFMTMLGQLRRYRKAALVNIGLGRCSG